MKIEMFRRCRVTAFHSWLRGVARFALLQKSAATVSAMLVLCGAVQIAQAQSAAISMPTAIVLPATEPVIQSIDFAGHSPGGILQNYRYSILHPDGSTQESVGWTPFSSTTTPPLSFALGEWVTAERTSSNVVEGMTPPDFLTEGFATGTVTITRESALGFYTIKLDVQDANGDQASASQTYEVVATEEELISDGEGNASSKSKNGENSKSKFGAKSGKLRTGGQSGQGKESGAATSKASDTNTGSKQSAAMGGFFQLVIRTPSSEFYALKTSDWTLTPVAAP